MDKEMVWKPDRLGTGIPGFEHDSKLSRHKSRDSSSVNSSSDPGAVTICSPVSNQHNDHGKSPSYQHLTAPHKVILWPAVHIFLNGQDNFLASELADISREGTIWFMGRLIAKTPRLKHSLPSMPSSAGYRISHPDHSTGTIINTQAAQQFAEAYFNTFHLLHPFLDEDSYMDYTLPSFLNGSCASKDTHHVVALLVLALGQMGLQSIEGEPMHYHHGVASGIRGGSEALPPGIELFNEARRCIGFTMTGCTLENIQIFLLEAIYFEANAMHMDYWRCTVEASTTCEAMLRLGNIDWISHHGDMIKRVFWACVVNEDLYHMDLDLPESGVFVWEKNIAFPTFVARAIVTLQTPVARQKRLQCKLNYLAMLALRKLISHIHTSLRDSEFNDIIHVYSHTSSHTSLTRC
jgi:hypothetical protein